MESGCCPGSRERWLGSGCAIGGEDPKEGSGDSAKTDNRIGASRSPITSLVPDPKRDLVVTAQADPDQKIPRDLDWGGRTRLWAHTSGSACWPRSRIARRWGSQSLTIGASGEERRPTPDLSSRLGGFPTRFALRLLWAITLDKGSAAARTLRRALTRPSPRLKSIDRPLHDMPRAVGCGRL